MGNPYALVTWKLTPEQQQIAVQWLPFACRVGKRLAKYYRIENDEAQSLIHLAMCYAAKHNTDITFIRNKVIQEVKEQLRLGLNRKCKAIPFVGLEEWSEKGTTSDLSISIDVEIVWEAAIELLTYEEYQAMRLYYHDGFSYKEIGDFLNRTPEAISARCKKAIQLLQDYFFNDTET